MRNFYHLKETCAEVSTDTLLAGYVDVPRFEALCRQCGNFGALWSCPPCFIDPVRIWRQHRTLFLFGWKLTFSKEIQAQTFPGAAMQDVLCGTLYHERERMDRELLRRERQTAGSRALFAGSCRLCGQTDCSRREGLPCRFPGRMRCSIESLGGDVGRISQELLHIPLLWIQEDRLPAYLTLVGGLLV